ncbi:MAG: SusD/RagB family nutrient-binding outer membrane lipoprotein [Chloroflexia bacterium]|nr:SusD/RagB family nutrient-binding outer membrane lipoprotein [Chloroflexia bacterium]
MKKIIKYILLVPIVFAYSCTGLMDDLNEDSKGVTAEKLTPDGNLSKLRIQAMQKNLFNLTTSWQYQVQQNLNADVFAGYTMHPGSFNQTTTNDNYNWNHGWNGWAFTVAQANLTDFLALYEETENATINTDFYACGLILKVLTTLPLVDGFGPFPYLDYGVGSNPAFDDVEDIYLQGFIPELNSAIDILNSYKDGPFENRVANSKADLTNLGGTNSNWVKLANTIKLRLALRISNVNPSEAEKIIQEALNEPDGFIDASTGDVTIDVEVNEVFNPFSFISVAWSDCIMSADMQSFLVGYKDPRLASYFLPATTGTVTGAGAIYAGLRPGAALTSDKGAYANYSKIYAGKTFKIVSAAESYFLLAEASARSLGGLTPGQAEGYYTNGVSTSFAANGVGAEAGAYLSSTDTPADYVDYAAADNNYTATTTVTPEWTGTDMIEKIITQKWIALFPNGAEAWAEFRRTGFPRLTLPKNMENGANFDGTIPQGEFLKRMPYPSNIIGISPAAANTAISSFLNGNDNGYQALWWDVN